MFSYIAYGLGIHSILPLPELIAREGAADVVVRLGKVDRSLLEAVDEYHAFWATPTEACHFFRGVGAFLVRDGHEVIVDPVPGVDMRVLRLSLLGPTMGLILHQRGRFVLHASTIAITGSAIAFLGGNGSGKSTIAAALHARGHDLLADDVTAMHIGSGCPTVLPSFPQFKLWPDSAVALGNVPETMPLLHPDLDKRACCVTERFAHISLPLRRLYVLARGPTPEIEFLPPQEALRELMRHWYGTRFGRWLLQVVGIAPYFLQCASLANRVNIRRLKRPPSLEALPDLARLVEQDLAEDRNQDDNGSHYTP